MRLASVFHGLSRGGALVAAAWLCAGPIDAPGVAAPARAQPASFSLLVKAQRGKVVHITTRNSGEGEPEAFSPFRYPERPLGTGSGFIVNREGLILTNHHVIAGAAEIEVILENDERYKAEVVGADERTDLALLRIAAKGLTPVDFGNSELVEVGDWVVAIGNPLGLDYSVTAGIISAKGRNIFNAENVAYGEFLQTDAAINPGNSGGPLFNLAGQVIGVNTAVSRQGQGIGFAVPSNLVVAVVKQLRQHGRVVRGWLGVVIQDLNPELAKTLALPARTRGVLVNDIVPGAPAAQSPMRKGDVLTAIGGERLRKVAHLQKLIALTTPGSEVRIDALRREAPGSGWAPQSFTLRVGSAPDETADATGNPLAPLGFAVADLTDADRIRLSVKPGVGVAVKQVAPRGRAAAAGLHAQDVIVEANRQEVSTSHRLAEIVQAFAGRRLSLVVQREAKVLYLVLSIRD